MADNEKVVFRRGPLATIPETKVAGTVYITNDTGEMFVDDTNSSRFAVTGGNSGITLDQIDTICEATIQSSKEVKL